MAGPRLTLIPPAEIIEAKALKQAATDAILAYLSLPNDLRLQRATEAVEAYRCRYGPLVVAGRLWTTDGVGELVKFPAAKATRKG